MRVRRLFGQARQSEHVLARGRVEALLLHLLLLLLRLAARFFELVGFSSYLLIAHYFTTDEAAQASKKAFIVNRVGDFGFLIGIVLTYWTAGTVNLVELADQVDFARENGYVETVLGRRRYLNDINSQNAVVRGAAERNAVNAPIQGSAADIIKLAMINIHKRMTQENWQSKMLLQVHDELVFDAPKTEVDALTKMVKHEMENAFSLDVPLVVDVGIGKNWLEAH